MCKSLQDEAANLMLYTVDLIYRAFSLVKVEKHNFLVTNPEIHYNFTSGFRAVSTLKLPQTKIDSNHTTNAHPQPHSLLLFICFECTDLHALLV